MIPEHWIEHRRGGDRELIGFVVPEGEDFVPTSLLGTPLGPVGPWEDAEARLDEIGIGYLADTWLLRHDDGSEQRVALVEVDRERVVVANADFANVVGADHGARVELEVPTDRLRLA